MELKRLSDHDLLQTTDRLVQQERNLLALLLRHLQEVERRRLFSSLGHSSLFDYCVRRLGYPEDQAHRRISAMRLLKEIPELEEKIERGALTLTNIGLAKKVFSQKEHSREEKLELLSQMENKTSREAEKIVAEIAPELPRQDAQRNLCGGKIEYRFSANESIEEKIAALRGLLAYKHPHLSLGELFELLCEMGLKSLQETAAPRDGLRQSKAALKRAIWQRDKSKCLNCGSIYALEIDHKIPKAKGGSHDPGNLRLLCRHCNQRAAVLQFGAEKMERYLS